jgi:hypothetical protein
MSGPIAGACDAEAMLVRVPTLDAPGDATAVDARAAPERADVTMRKEETSWSKGRCYLSTKVPEVTIPGRPELTAKIARALLSLESTPDEPDCKGPPDRHVIRRSEPLDRKYDELNVYGATDAAVELNESGLLSITYRTSLGQAGAAHPNNSYSSVTIDLATGEAIPYRALFREGSDVSKRMHSLIEEAAASAGLSDVGIEPRDDYDYYLRPHDVVIWNIMTGYALQGFEAHIPVSRLLDILEPTGPLARLSRFSRRRRTHSCGSAQMKSASSFDRLSPRVRQLPIPCFAGRWDLPMRPSSR